MLVILSQPPVFTTEQKNEISQINKARQSVKLIKVVFEQEQCMGDGTIRDGMCVSRDQVEEALYCKGAASGASH